MYVNSNDIFKIKNHSVWWLSKVQNTSVLLFQRNLVRLWASYKKLWENTTEESHTIGSLPIQIDKLDICTIEQEKQECINHFNWLYQCSFVFQVEGQKYLHYRR